MSTATRTSSRHSYSDIQLSSLTSGAQLLVWSARQWLACAKTQRCVHEALALPYAQHNISQAIMPLDESMTLLALGASRQIELGCLCASVLREDERTLLAAFRYLQCNDSGDAAYPWLLETHLLSYRRRLHRATADSKHETERHRLPSSRANRRRSR